jgi:hypothetical protein
MHPEDSNVPMDDGWLVTWDAIERIADHGYTEASDDRGNDRFA